MPAACRLSAVASPPMPPPTTKTIIVTLQSSQPSFVIEHAHAGGEPLRSMAKTALLDPDVSALNELSPPLGFGSEARRELFSALCRHAHTQCGEVRGDGRITQGFPDRSVEQIDDR